MLSSKRDRNNEKVKLRLYWTGSESGNSPTSSHNESVSKKTTLDGLQERLRKKFKQMGKVAVRHKGLQSTELLETDGQLQAFFERYFVELELSQNQHSSSSFHSNMATYRLKLQVSAATSSPQQRSPGSLKQSPSVHRASPVAVQEHCLRPRNTLKVAACDTPITKRQKKNADLENASPSPRQDVSWDRGVLHSIIKTVAEHHFCAVQQNNRKKLTL